MATTLKKIGRFSVRFINPSVGSSVRIEIACPPGLTWEDATQNERIEFDAWVEAFLNGTQ